MTMLAHYPAATHLQHHIPSRVRGRAKAARLAARQPSQPNDANLQVCHDVVQQLRKEARVRGRRGALRPTARAASRFGTSAGHYGQAGLDLDEELIVDLFCGGGGASEGIELGTGRAVNFAVNHDKAAISMHRVNHPATEHYLTGVHDVCPRAATRGRPVGHLHASPDCKHFSQAKGGQPRSRAIRSLAWIMHRWAGVVAPRMITMENVQQMTLWTRLVAKRDPATGRVVRLDGTVAGPGERVPVHEQFLVPDKKSLGRTFNRFIALLRAKGYAVEYRSLVAADFGAPTTRERLYMIARNDGLPIIWPEPTHFKHPKKGQKAWRGAHECIDWSYESKSIFGRTKDLAPATLRRVAKGIRRFVLEADQPFIVPSPSHGAANLAPVMIQAGHGEGSSSKPRWSHGNKSPLDPLGTVTASGGGQALAYATLIQTGYGERQGQEPRVPGLAKPLGTIVAGGAKHALVTAYMMQANGGFNTTAGHDMLRPMTTVTTAGSQQQLVTANLLTLRHHSVGIDARSPLPTVAAGGEHHALLHCVLSQEEHESAMQVARFLHGADGEPAANDAAIEPVRLEIDGVSYVIVDITLRMLQPKELFAAQGFPANYIYDRGADGEPMTKTDQIRMCGNSVSPVVMAAIVAANTWSSLPMRLAA